VKANRPGAMTVPLIPEESGAVSPAKGSGRDGEELEAKSCEGLALSVARDLCRLGWYHDCLTIVGVPGCDDGGESKPPADEETTGGEASCTALVGAIDSAGRTSCDEVMN
jgi:hypothetical protein